MDANTGVLTQSGTTPVPAYTTTLAATPKTGCVFVGDWNPTKEILTFRADPASGVLTQGSTLATPNLQYAATMLVTPNNQTLYVTDADNSDVWAFSIASDCSLSVVAGSPFSTSQIGATYLTADNSGHLLFVSGANNAVYGFTINGDGSLTPTAGSPTTVRPPTNSPGKGPQGVMAELDPDGRFLYVLDQFNAVVYVYTVNGTGALTTVPGSPFADGGVYARVLAATTKFAFAPDATVAALDVNQSSGALTPAPGSPFDNGPSRSGGSPVQDAKVDAAGRFLLLADWDTGKISVFSIDQATGALTNVPGSPFLAGPGSTGPQSIAITY